MIKRMALAALSAAALSASAATASAQPYDNTDPVTTGCNSGSYTVTTANVRRSDDNSVVGSIELRWSPSCGTNWGRLTPASGISPGYARIDVGRPADDGWASWDVSNNTTWPVYGDQLNGSQNCVYAVGFMTVSTPGGLVGASGETGCY